MKVELEANVQPDGYSRESECYPCNGTGRWQSLEEVELMIMECEDMIGQIEYAQQKASTEGDIELYQKLQKEKELYEDRVGLLIEEYSYLERM